MIQKYLLILSCVVLITGSVRHENVVQDSIVVPVDISKRKHTPILPKVVEETRERILIELPEETDSEPAVVPVALVEYPEYITVRVTGRAECERGTPYTIVEVPFMDYVKGVMVNEFGFQHPIYTLSGERLRVIPHTDETLKTSAMIIKNYALHQYYTDGKWGGYEQGIVYDCDWDMVYNPAITNEVTDKAVEDTWNFVIVYEGTNNIVPTYFNAYYGGCIQTHGVDGKCVHAWQYGGIFQQGDRGWTMEEMLYDAYYNVEIKENYVNRNETTSNFSGSETPE